MVAGRPSQPIPVRLASCSLQIEDSVEIPVTSPRLRSLPARRKRKQKCQPLRETVFLWQVALKSGGGGDYCMPGVSAECPPKQQTG